MGLAEVVQQLLEEQKLSAADLAARVGLDANDTLLADVALYDDELTSTLNAVHASAVASALGDRLWQALGISCPACGGHRLRLLDECKTSVGQMIQRMRQCKSMSEDELGDVIGFYGSVIRAAEQGTVAIDEAVSLAECRTLAEALSVPLGTLLRLGCNMCGWSACQ